MNQPQQADSRESTETLLLDAAERLLIEIGYAAITTRRLAEEAGANHGLIHYYFGSMEELFVRVLERFTARLIERQQAMYARADSYPDKWRAAMGYLDADRPYQKIWFELQAMAWNRPGYRQRIVRVREAWGDAMRQAVGDALARYRLEDSEFPREAWIALIATVNEGIMLERLSGIEHGHTELLRGIQHWLDGLERSAELRDKPRPKPKRKTR